MVGSPIVSGGVRENKMRSRYRIAVWLAAGCTLLACAGAGGPVAGAAATGLVAAYSFDEGAGTAVGDASGSGNNGTVANTTWSTAGRFGGALSFNGSSTVNIPDAPSLRLTTSMTLEAWVNPSRLTSEWRDVVYKADDNYYLMATSANGGLPAGGASFGNTAATTEAFGTSTLTVNTWSHLAVTYDGATIRLYVNGTQVSTRAKTGPFTASSNPLQIGGNLVYGQFFTGPDRRGARLQRPLSANRDPERHERAG